MERTTLISPADVEQQLAFCQSVAELTARWPEGKPLAFVDTYGCQQNEADSERIRGYLEKMGFGFTDSEEEARIIVINTCAIREHAEQRVFGNVELDANLIGETFVKTSEHCTATGKENTIHHDVRVEFGRSLVECLKHCGLDA